MTFPQQLSSSQSSPEVPINENFAALSAYAIYSYRADTSSGLTWGFYGGRWGGTLVAEGLTLTLSPSATNYVVVLKSTGVASVSTSTTNWDSALYARVYKLTTSNTAVTAVEDHRAGPNGVASGAFVGTTDSVPEGSTNLYHTAARVLATVLSGFSTASSAVVTAADTVLSALGKLQAQITLRATLASPTFTGTPAAPTAAVDTNTTQLATTAFVLGQAASATSPMNGTATVGTSNRYARQDHVHASDTSRLALAGGTMTGVFNEAAGAAVASAATVNLTTATGNTVHITGTTTITAITLANGARRQVIFDDSLTLTHGANLQLPGAANIQTRAGDRMIIVADNAGVDYVVDYVRADGSPLLSGTDPDDVVQHRDLGSAAYLQQTWLHASATFDPGSVANGAQTTTTVAVPGAVFGDFVLPPSLSISAAGMEVSGFVDAANSVTVIYQNTSGGAIDLASHTVFVRVMKRLAE